MQKANKPGKFLWVIITGILFSYILSNVLTAGKWNSERFLAEGQVFEVQESVLKKSNDTWIYNDSQDCYVIAGNDAVKRFGKWNEAVAWEGLYIDIEELDREPVDFVFKHLDENNKQVGQTIITLKNGKNYIELNPEVPFWGFKIQILGGDELKFRLKGIRLTENFPDRKKMVILFAAVLAVYLTAAVMIIGIWGRTLRRKARKLNAGDRVLYFLQSVYELIFRASWKKWGYRKSKRQQRMTRILLFVFLFVYMVVVYDQGIYQQRANYKYHALVAAVVFLWIAWVSGRKNIVRLQWNNRLAYCWIAFFSVVCISDFAVNKNYKFLGWEMLLAGGMLFFVWQQMEQPEDVICNMMRALEIAFIPEVIYLIFFRQKYDGILYNGVFKNPEEFCVLSLMMLWVFMVEFYGCIRRREKGTLLPLYGLGIALNFYNVLQTGELLGIDIAIVVLELLLIMLTAERESVIRKYAGWFCICLVTVCAGVYLYHTAITKLPEMTGTNVVLQGEQFYTHKSEEEMETLKESGNEIYQKLKVEDSDQKAKVRKSYFREMNLSGHSNAVLTVWNKKKTADNSVLQIMYRYGIIAAICYILLFWEYGKALLADFKRKRKQKKAAEADLFAVGAFALWIVSGFFWNIENPFVQPIWIVVYLLMGKYIGKESEC